MNRNDLDRHITGNYGEDQFTEDDSKNQFCHGQFSYMLDATMDNHVLYLVVFDDDGSGNEVPICECATESAAREKVRLFNNVLRGEAAEAERLLREWQISYEKQIVTARSDLHTSTRKFFERKE